MNTFFINHKSTLSILLSLLTILSGQTLSYADITSVSDRTEEVRDAIIAALGVNTADEVRETHLAAITALNLRDKGITVLKTGDFSGMTGLTSLNLYDNELSSLPDGIFEGLTALTTLRLGNNTVDPMQISVTLEKVGENQFKAVVPTGAPFAIIVPVSVTNGTITGGTTTLTVSKGSTASNAVSVSRTANTTNAVTANIGTLPSLPANHYGYTLTKPGSLPLEIIGAESQTEEPDPTEMTEVTDPTINAAPIFTDGSITTRAVVENTVANTNIGNAVAATDTDADTLTYSLSGIDANSFELDSATGQLKTKADLDYETKHLYSISITVSDGELTDTITVIVNVIDASDTTTDITSLAVSDRTAAVSDAIVAAIPGVDATEDVTDTHLAAITGLNLRNVGITELKTGDFGGLTALTNLNLYGNMLDSLPIGIFKGLNSLTSLRLGGNFVDPMPLMVSLQQVTVNQFKVIIPAGAPFDIVVPLNDASIPTITISKGSVESDTFTATTTDVSLGALPSLPANHFGYILAKSTVCNRTIQVSDAIVETLQDIDDCRNVSDVQLATITMLDLGSESIASLSSDDFSGLLSLTSLDLSNNQLEDLPDGIFQGLTSLTILNLSGNTTDPLLLSLTLQKVGDNMIQVVLPAGAPYHISLPITVTNGSLSNSLTVISIAKGSVMSQLHTVTRTPNTFGAVTVSIDSVPSLPTGHTGYALEETNQTSLEIFKALNVAPVFTEGETASRSIAENTAAGINIGSAIAATDADGDTLIYSLTGTDAASFDIDTTNGQIKTKAALDYETKTTYSVNVSVSDGKDGSDSIAVTINVTDVSENRAPVFTEGSSTTRTVSENTSSDVGIGSPISATDADGDTLTYSLTGTDAASFDIDTTNGQIKTKAALDYETKATYAVMVTVSDGKLTDTINITINITDVVDNRAPVFTEGESATRIVAENTSAEVDIGSAVAATDADDDTLTYSLEGADTSAFSIVSTSGQLRTKAALDYETKSSYTVTITVSDGEYSDSISITINVTDIDETSTSVVPETANSAPVFTDGSSATRSVAENTGSGVNIGNPVAATDADKDTLTYSLTGADASFFSIDSSSGQLRTSAALDYETKTSYSVRLTVTDGNEGSDTIIVTINITDVDESSTNTVPVFTEGESATRSVAENTGSGVDIGNPISATDADNDTLTYGIGGTDVGSFSIGSTTGQLRTNAALDYETKASYSVRLTVSDGNGGSDTIIVTINITDVDESSTNTVPVFTEGESATRSVAENTGSGVDIGNPVSATDADDDTLTYGIGGTDVGSFSIGSTTGQLRTSAALDYETKTSYSVTITVSDGNGGSDTITVTITITDVSERPANNAPVFSDGSSTTRSVAENTGTGLDIGDAVSATDADNDTLTYSLEGTDAASFTIDSTSGQLRTDAALDYETKSTYTVTISVSDGVDGSASITVTINVTDVDESPTNNAPIFTQGATTTLTVAENTASGTNIGNAVSATDADDDTLTYSLTGTDAASFSIDTSSGQVKTSSALNFETKSSYVVAVNVSDGNGGSDSITVTINVTNVNETPVFTDGVSTTRTIAENVNAGINIGSAVAATDVDGDTLTYSLSGTNAASFDIESTTGQLKTKAALDYETKASYTVTIGVSDGNNGSDSITVTITVRNLDETPSNIAPVFTEGATATRTVAENTATGVNIGTPISATDADTNTLAYLLSGTGASAFSIDGETGQLKTSTVLNFESKSTYTVTVTVSDGSLSDTITVTVNITNVNEAPVFAEGENATRSVAENTAAGVNIGTAVTAADPDADTTFTYSLSGTDAASFDIVNTSGQLKTKAALDYETKTRYEVKVKVSDGTLEDEITITINVTDVDENRAPTFDDGETTSRSIAENTGQGVDIGDAVSATDPDTDDTLTYRLTGTDAASFSIVSTTGQLRTKAALDYEDDNSYAVTVTVSDGNGGSDTINVTINITDVDENRAPTFSANSATLSVAENTGSGVDIGSAVSATDPDTGDTLTYGLTGTDAASFDINSATGQIRTKAALDYEDKNSYSVTVSVSDGNGGSASIAVTINVTDVDENRAPTFSANSATRSVAENTGSGVDIGSAVSATDPDTGDTLTYGLTGTDAASFDINSTTGQLRTKAALDYEDKNSYSVTVSVSDGNGGSASIAVTINVTDVDENRAPTFSANSATRSVAENTGSGVDIGSAVSATDPDTGDTLTYGLTGTDAASFDIDSTTGQIRTKAALDYEDKNSYSVTVSVSDGNGGSASIAVTINVTDVDENRAPVFADASTTRSIAENTAAAQNIGDAVTATDADDDTLTYGIGGTDAASFSIESGTGQLKTKAALDYETKSSYSVSVFASDPDNATDSITVTINVTDANDAPVFSEGASTTRAIAENTVANTNIGNAVTATDQDTDDTLTYSLAGTDAASLSIVTTSGQLKTKAALNYETKTSYSVTVTATDDSGASNDATTITVTINITDVDENRAPTFSANSFNYRIADIASASVGDMIGTAVTATDPDDDTLTYSLGGTDASYFTIETSTGKIQVTQTLIDHTSSSYSINVIASDGNGGTAEVSGTILVTRISRQNQTNNTPVFTDGASTDRSIAENTASGENIGTAVAATDADTGDTLTYSLEGTDASSFSIVSTSGQLQTSAALNYEEKSTYSVTVKVTDDSGASNNSATIAVTINITDVEEGTTPVSERTPVVRDAIVNKVPDISNAADVTEEHLAAITGTLSLATSNIVSLRAGDFDGLTSLTYLDLDWNTNLSSIPAGIFDDLTSLTTLEMENNKISSLPTGVFDNLTSLINLDLDGCKLSSLPAGIFANLTSLRKLELFRNQFNSIPNGMFVNLTSLSDVNLHANPVDPLPLPIALEQVVDGQFKAVAVTGAPFDITVPVSVTNGSITGGATSVTISQGATDSETLTVTRTTGTTAHVVASIGTLPDIPTNHTGYTLTKGQNAIVIRGDNVTPVFTDGSSTTRSIRENTDAGTNIGDPISATDLGDTLTYSLEGTDASSFSIVTTSGQLQTSTALDYETKSSYSVTVKVVDDSGASNNSATITVTINIIDVNESITPVSERTADVRNAIVSKVPGIYNATDVTAEHLAAIGGTLNLRAYNIQGLKVGDFDGLTSLTGINLSINTAIGTLPPKIFDDLISLRSLDLFYCRMSSLPSGVFDNLTSLTDLRLDSNSFTTLPPGIFEKLTSLSTLDLRDNDFSSIPAGIFVNLTSLSELHLEENSVEPLSLPIALELVAQGQFKAVAVTGAPFDITVPVSVTNGSITGGATSVSISQGATDSETLTVTRTAGTTDDVIASIGTLPGRPSDHSGYVLTKGSDLNVFRADNNIPVFTDGSSTTRSIQERTPSNVHIGDPVSATDADNDRLTYTLSGTDAALFSIESTTGQLITNGALDYETSTSHVVTVDVADTFGGTASISVTINVTDLDETPPEIPLSDRNIAVRNAILGKLPNVHSADDVFQVHLNGIRSIDLSWKSISSLSADDFDGLTGLTYLNLQQNDISSFPADVFDDLTSLTFLNISYNDLTSLPAGLFDNLTSLNTLHIEGCNISTLPSGLFDNLTSLSTLDLEATGLTSLSSTVFDSLTSLTRLDMHNNNLTSLPSGIFDQLSNSWSLTLSDNQISSLPEGILSNLSKLEWFVMSNNNLLSLPDRFFDGLTSLTSLGLSLNPGAPFDITVSIEKVGTDKIKLVCPIGAPISIGASVITVNCSYSGGNITPRIPKGAVESPEYTLVRDAGTTEDAVVYLSLLPLPPPDDRADYQLIYDETRINIFKGNNEVPEFTEGTSASRSVIEGTPSGRTIGEPVTATDADANDALTYSLGGTDADSFSIDSTTGQLKTSATLDYDTKNSYAVTVSVSDGFGGTDSIDITINVTEFDDSDPSVSLSSRSSQVSDAIVQALSNVSTAADVKTGHLLQILAIDLSSESISSLTADDFDGLTNLRELTIFSNNLSSLPSGIFDGLSSLVSLNLGNNGLTSLSDDVFDDLTALTYLNLENNSLTSLPSGIFDNLTAMVTLDISDNSISSLPDNLLTSMTTLDNLDISNNSLSTLPDGLLANGRLMTTINLSGNSTDPFTIFIKITKVADGQIKAVCPVGAPVDLNVAVIILNGAASGEETHNGLSYDSMVIPAGSTEGGVLDIVRTSTNSVILVRAIAHFMIEPGHRGYLLAIDPTRPPVILPAINLAPQELVQIPDKTDFLPNYPNPFNPETWIPYQLSKPADVTLTIYNMRGVVVRTLALGQQKAGFYTSQQRAAHWDGRNSIGEKVATGVYFVTFKAGDFTATRKMLIRK